MDDEQLSGRRAVRGTPSSEPVITEERPDVSIGHDAAVDDDVAGSVDHSVGHRVDHGVDEGVGAVGNGPDTGHNHGLGDDLESGFDGGPATGRPESHHDIRPDGGPPPAY